MDNNRRVVELPLDDVLPNRFQPRIKFNEEAIEELCSSIKEHGVIQPIVVRAVGDRYEIIAGERRYKAATLAGLQTIPAIITDLNDKDSAEVALIENVQRQDLTPIEEAISYKKILDMGYLTQDDLAQKLGKNQSTVANKLRLLNLDEDVQEALLNGKISERHARSLLKLNNPKDQIELLNRIINERLTVRKTDEEIDKMLNREDINDLNNIASNTGFNKQVEVLDFDDPVMVPTEDVSNYNIPSAPIIEQNQNEDKVNIPFEFNIPSPVIEENKSEDIEIPKFSDILNNQVEDETGDDDSGATKEIETTPELTPGKFFNILGESDNNAENTSSTDNSFNNYNFGFPTIDDSAFNNNQTDFQETITDTTINNNTYASDMKTVISTIRNCAETIEKYGYKIDTEEFDLEDVYQVIFKIHKK